MLQWRVTACCIGMMMANFYFIFAAVCLGLAHCRRLSDDIDNDISSNEVSVTVPFQRNQDFVKIVKAPYGILKKEAGSRVELECEAIGSPPPVMQWLKGNTVLTDNEGFESNLINGIPGKGRAQTKIRLVINKALSVHEGTFTCMAEAGEKVASATTQLKVNVNVDTEKNFTQLLTESILGAHRRPRIVYFQTTLLDFMGNDIALPCRAVGSPQPEILWLDSAQNIVGREAKSRLSVLPDGELRIRNVRWEDMGQYTCIAQNSLGEEDSIHTFLYPLALKASRSRG